METTVLCTFEQRLTAGDVSKLAKMIGAIVPIPSRHHLIGSAQVGLNAIINDKQRDYARVRTRMRDMTYTVMRQVEGNQMVLGILEYGRVYTVKNTGPALWEKGDVLTALAPVFSTESAALVTVGNWQLVLPWIVPLPLATEINQRLLLIALLSLDRSREEVRAASAQLRTVRYRDATILLPELSLNDTTLVDLRNVCISLSMIANLASEVVMTYVRKLALEDSSMLLMKCQEILTRQDLPRGGGNAGHGDSLAARGRNPNMTPTEELNKLTALLVMIRQISDIVAEQPLFVVCDISPDDKSAVCIFKG
ncbi:pR85 [rat cytomegalovirus strain Maastricht]|uniref:PR85 n=1 Tax=Rat cytomegalovirus (strain Maastricht) TaxID=79700 RepID=Q9DWB7_RCMVM|nr:pR85 [rat cytomegalovirus strain Maastricht]AAF99173.1 pR85 [rat cytomegalovirus strain Maastricht]WEG72006.1 capsid triplex subunit 2 [Murid betaherpesvirus 2]